MADDKLTQEELGELLAERIDSTKSYAVDLIHALQESWEEGLQSNGSCRLSGLGVFRLKWHEERQGYNPSTQQPMTIEAQNRLDFSPESKVANRINQEFAHLEAITLTDSNVTTEEYSVQKLSAEESSKVEQLSEKNYSDEQEQAFSSSRSIYSSDPKRKAGKSNRSNLILLFLLLLLVLSGSLWYFFFYTPNENVASSEKVQQKEEMNEMEQDSENESVSDQQNVVQDPKTEKSTEVKTTTTYQVKQGDNLWEIAERTYGAGHLWVFIYAANRDLIKNPDLIYASFKLKIPDISNQQVSNQISRELIDAYKLASDAYQPYSLEKYNGFKKEMNRLKSLSKW